MNPAESTLDQLLKARQDIDAQLRQHQAILTILFTDVVGSTAYFERYGDLAGVALMHQHARLGETVVTEFGGRVIKTIGDSVMAEFPSPVPGVRAAIELQRRLLQMNQTLEERDRLQLRIGLNHGPCVRAGSDVFGDAVNLAARVTKKTGPAQVLISRSVREAITGEGDLRCTHLGAVTLAGKAEKEDIFEIVWMETGEYRELRENVTSALKRGDLMSPGLKLEDLAPSPPPEVRPPAGRSGEIVTNHETADVIAATPPAPITARYEILGQLGQGGMGVVYKARDRETGDLVALKVLRSEIAADAEGLARFKNELRTARKITHKNICRIHEFNRTEISAYISMEFLEGESLRSIIKRQGAMNCEEAIPIAKQICAGLGEAHAQGVVHRDLKPENVMVDAAGNVKVMDFGIARSDLSAGMTQAGAVVGTPAYMAPEQAEGTGLDNRTDIYALGLILYEMFAGVQPFRAPTPVAVVLKHISESPTPPRTIRASIPPHIEAAILRCLEKKPAARFQSVEELSAALSSTGAECRAYSTGAMATADSIALAGRPAPPPAAFQTPVPMPAREATPAPRPVVERAPTDSGHKMGMMIGAILAIGLFAAVVVFKSLRAPQAPGQASQPAAEVSAAANPAPANSKNGSASSALGATAPAPAAQNALPVASNPLSSGTAAAPSSAAPTARAALEGASPAPPYAGAPSAPAMAPLVAIDFSNSGTLAGHTAQVSGVAISPDGRLVATASDDRTVRVWDAMSGQQLQKITGHTDAAIAVAFSGDGRMLASASRDHTVRVWDAGSGGELKTLPKDSAVPVCLAFDKNFLFVGDSEGHVKILEMPAGRLQQNFQEHTGPIFSLAVSGDGDTLVTGGRDGLVRVRRRSAPEPLDLRGHTGPVNAVAVSRDARRVASAGEDGTVRLWDAASGQALRMLTGHSGSVEGVAFSPDARWVASAGSDRSIKVWDVASGKELKSLEAHISSLTKIAASRDGKLLASASGDRTVKLWRRMD